MVKRTVLLLLCYEFADIMTTVIGLQKGLTEQNVLFSRLGMMQFIGLKIFLTIIVALVIQFKKPYKTDTKLNTILLIIVSIPVIWNIFAILFETY